ncbi:hypothetical protein IAD21_01318 [Abditibacteriota bacterium]|nr:hypothetical protein IAD21_01318 [Abditibacteriota bacterium]
MTRSPVSVSPSSVASSSYPPLSRREIKWGQFLLVVFLLLVSLPYLWCALITVPGFTWGGLFFSADDQNVHLMWAKQAQECSLFIRDLFTTEGLTSGAKPLFFNLFTLGVGLAARITGIDGIFFYHIARVAFAGLFVHQLHRLLIAATGGAPDRENARLGALALATLTTGGGFMLAFAPPLMGKVLFLDHPTNSTFVTVPEAFALLSALIYPLNIASFALLCFLLRALIENRNSTKDIGKAFLAALVLSNIHTYDALPILLMCITGLFIPSIGVVVELLFRRGKLAKAEQWGEELSEVTPKKRDLKVWSAILIGSIIPIIYQALVFRGSEEFRVKALTSTSPPAIYQFATTFAPLLLLGAWAWYKRTRWTAGVGKWLGIYAVSLIALVYAPKPGHFIEALFLNQSINAPIYIFSFARKMIEGLQIPLLVFAGAGLAALPYRKYTAPLVIFILSLSPFIFWLWTIDNASHNNMSRVTRFLMPPYYFSNADAGALLALQKVPDKNQAVLCLPLIGNYVPRTTGLFTYTGHWAETLHLNRKLGVELRFYQGQMSPAEARTFLKTNHIGYIIESPYERKLAPNPSVAKALGFHPIYSADSPDGPTLVFQVND